jgi:hypothetical protein
MSKKRMLADVLWEAANCNLWNGRGREPSSQRAKTCGESCCAAAFAEAGKWLWWSDAADRESVRFLRSLGCDTGSTGFYGFERGQERQGARYMWLLLAMHVAEDEGIEL